MQYSTTDHLHFGAMTAQTQLVAEDQTISMDSADTLPQLFVLELQGQAQEVGGRVVVGKGVERQPSGISAET